LVYGASFPRYFTCFVFLRPPFPLFSRSSSSVESRTSLPSGRSYFFFFQKYFFPPQKCDFSPCSFSGGVSFLSCAMCFFTFPQKQPPFNFTFFLANTTTPPPQTPLFFATLPPSPQAFVAVFGVYLFLRIFPRPPRRFHFVPLHQLFFSTSWIFFSMWSLFSTSFCTFFPRNPPTYFCPVVVPPYPAPPTVRVHFITFFFCNRFFPPPTFLMTLSETSPHTNCPLFFRINPPPIFHYNPSPSALLFSVVSKHSIFRGIVFAPPPTFRNCCLSCFFSF